MGEIRVTPPDWATQRASWYHHSPDVATFKAAVHRQHGVVDEVGQQGWAYELGFVPASGKDAIGWHRTFADPGGLIYAMTGRLGLPRTVLATLASTVGCWAELVRTDPDGDHSDLFPASCRDFLAGAERFVSDVEFAPGRGWR
jgi:hypothetical protein